MSLAAEVRKVVYGWLRQGRWGSGILYSLAAYLYWLVRARRLYVGARIVEIPWVLAHLGNHARGDEKILQVGNVLLHKGALGTYEVELVDLDAEESPGRGLRVHKDDVRQVSLHQHYFDIAISISTLEHIGLQGPKFPDGDKLAVDIIARALRPGGLFLLTVPFGKPAVLESFRVYDASRLSWVLEDQFTVRKQSYFVWNGFMWEKKSCQDAEKVGFLKNNPSMNCGIALVEAKKART